MSEREDDFLGRWSRRKAEARGGGLKKKSEAPVETEAPVHKPGRMRTDPLPPKSEAATMLEDAADEATTQVQEAALREDLGEDQVPAPAGDNAAVDDDAGEQPETEEEDFEKIDFDSLDYDSDYTKFMKAGVPEAVRKRALRMLWGSNPILANIDGLNDYDDDFTDAALAVKGLLKTSYKAGSGYLTPEEIDASYSEEARLAGVEPEEDKAKETSAKDTEDAKAETELAEAGSPGEEQPEKAGNQETQAAQSDEEPRADNDIAGVSGKSDDKA